MPNRLTVMRFIAECINQAEADGYQQFEDVSEEGVVPLSLPDGWGYSEHLTEMWFRFGGSEFRVTISKKRG